MKDWTLIPDGKGGAALNLDLGGDPALNGIIMSLGILKGTWWHSPGFGLDWREKKITSRSVAILRERALQALAWMTLPSGPLASVEVETGRAGTHRVGMKVTATAKDGRTVEYERFVGVI